MGAADVEREVAAGARFVFFEYCISFVVLTLRRPSRIYFVEPGQGIRLRGMRYSLVSLLLGWWGAPWGLIYTPLTIMNNLAGGCDVTTEVLASLRRQK
jgi:hypothetical protein